LTRRSWAPTRALLAGVVLLILETSGAAAASPPDSLRAELDGHEIPPVQVGQYYCHDLDHPVIRCYRSAEKLEAALATRRTATTRIVSAEPGAAMASAYVVIYQDRDFRGAYAYLSVSYPDLGAIGWNDRISSFIGQLATGGTFFWDIGYGGNRYPFGGYARVNYVGDAWNDKFSSVTNY
jgi:hypothetical protein